EKLIVRYAEGPAKLKAALAKAPADGRRWRPGAGKWSVNEIVCHCADAEINAAGRIRYLLAENRPTIVGYDQDEWAHALGYQDHPVELALAAVDAARAHTTALLRKLPDEAWAREGTHTERGRYTAEEWLKLYAEHLESHAAQIDRTVAAWRAAQASAGA